MPENPSSSVLLLELYKDVYADSHPNDLASFHEAEVRLVAALEKSQTSNAAGRTLYEDIIGSTWFLTNHSQFLLSFYGHLSIISLLVSAIAISFRITNNRIGENNLSYAHLVDEFRLDVVKHYLAQVPLPEDPIKKRLLQHLHCRAQAATSLEAFANEYSHLRESLTEENIRIRDQIEAILSRRNPAFEPGQDASTVRTKLAAEVGLIIGNVAMFCASGAVTGMAIATAYQLVGPAVVLPVSGAMIALISLSVATIAAISLGQQAHILNDLREKKQALRELLEDESELAKRNRELEEASKTKDSQLITELKVKIAELEQKRLLVGMSNQQINKEITAIQREIYKRIFIISLISLFVAAATSTVALTLYATITGVAIGTVMIGGAPVVIPALITTGIAVGLFALMTGKAALSCRRYKSANKEAESANKYIKEQIEWLEKEISTTTDPLKQAKNYQRLKEYQLLACNEKMTEHRSIRNDALQATAVYIALSVTIGVAIGMSTFGIGAIVIPLVFVAIAAVVIGYKQYKIHQVAKEIDAINKKTLPSVQAPRKDSAATSAPVTRAFSDAVVSQTKSVPIGKPNGESCANKATLNGSTPKGLSLS